MSSSSKKTDQNEVNAIQDLLQCSRSSAYCKQKKKVSKALRQQIVDWIMKILNVHQSPITCDK